VGVKLAAPSNTLKSCIHATAVTLGHPAPGLRRFGRRPQICSLELQIAPLTVQRKRQGADYQPFARLASRLIGMK